MQRGFNLVEMSIILVVTGLVLGAVLIPSHVLLEEDIYKEEERQLRRIEASVLGYAVRHKTDGKGLRAAGGAPPHLVLGTRFFSLPAGRPYLPCPDVTGDGYEDRIQYDRTGFVFTPVLLSATFVSGRPEVGDFLRQAGSCVATRGVLPWRTLGVSPADHWGNMYTYQVDGVIADALVGFNQNSFLDVYDQRVAVIVDGGSERYQRRTAVQSTIIINGGAGKTTDSTLDPVVICGGMVAVCKAGAGALILVAGGQVIHSGTFSDTIPYRPRVPHEANSGLPFVVLSHGANGSGAVNYHRNMQRGLANPATVNDGLACNEPVNGEANSAAWDAPAGNVEVFNFPQVRPPLAGLCRPANIGGAPGDHGFMFYQPRGENFDDVMLWMSFDELLNNMHQGGVLPAADFPVFSPY